MFDHFRCGRRKMRLKTIVKRLNQALEADPKAVRELVNIYVECGKNLAAETEILVKKNGDRLFVRMLGFLNGIVRTRKQPMIIALCDTSGNIRRFKLESR